MSDENAEQYMQRFIFESVKLSPEEEAICRQRFRANRLKIEAIRKKYENPDSLFLGFEKEYRSYENTTEREDEIIELLCQGVGYKECAAILHISLRTLKTHVSHIFQKEQCTTLQQLIVKKLTGKTYQNDTENRCKEIKDVATPEINNDAFNLLSNFLS